MKAILIALLLFFHSLYSTDLQVNRTISEVSSTTHEIQVELNIKYVNNMKNNNPFNIRRNDFNPWLGKVPDNKGEFESFTDLKYGIRAGLKLIENYYKKYHINTIYNLIHTFAPNTENDTENYIKFVCRYTGYQPMQELDLLDKDVLFSIAKAMLIMESGYHIDNQTLLIAYSLL